jgi:cytoskeletal protein RodZ
MSNYAIKRDLRKNTSFKSIIGRVGPLFWLLGLLGEIRLVRQIAFTFLVTFAIAGCSSTATKTSASSSSNNSVSTKSITDMLASLPDDLPACEAGTTTTEELKKSIESASGKVIKETETELTATFARNGFTQVVAYKLDSGICYTSPEE